MATLVCTGRDCYTESDAATYSDACSALGTSTNNYSGNNLFAGHFESGSHIVCESWLEFDTTGIPAGSTATSATLALYLTSDSLTYTQSIRARSHTIPEVLSTIDFEDTSNLSGYELLASLPKESGVGLDVGWHDFSSEDALLAAVNAAIGTEDWVGMVLATSLDEAVNYTGSPAIVAFYSDTYSSGLYAPKITVEYTVGAASFMQPKWLGVW